MGHHSMSIMRVVLSIHTVRVNRAAHRREMHRTPPIKAVPIVWMRSERLSLKLRLPCFLISLQSILKATS